MKKVPFVTLDKLQEITAQFPTPFHLYDEKGIRENAKAVSNWIMTDIIRVAREKEFAPRKNATGNDSPETAKKMYEDYIKTLKK